MRDTVGPERVPSALSEVAVGQISSEAEVRCRRLLLRCTTLHTRAAISELVMQF